MSKSHQIKRFKKNVDEESDEEPGQDEEQKETGLFFYIPDAALSAVIMVAVSTLVSPPSVFYQYFKINLWDFLSSMIALFVTIFVSVEAGIAAGVGFSLVVLLFRVARPNFHVLQQLKGRPDVYVDESATKNFDTVAPPHGVLVFRIEESTTFPNTETFKTWVVDEVYKYTRFGGRVKPVSERLWSDDLEQHIRQLRLIAHGPKSNITDNDLPKLRALILDFSAVNNIDSTGLQGLFDLRDILKDYAGVDDFPELFFELHFVGIQSNVLRILELSGITQPVGPIAMQKVEPLEDVVVQSVQSSTASSADEYGSDDHILGTSTENSSGIPDTSRNEHEVVKRPATLKKTASTADHHRLAKSEQQQHEMEDQNRVITHASLGAAGTSSVYGTSPFLGEEGLIHLTVRDAIDAILTRQEIWNQGTVTNTTTTSGASSGGEEEDEEHDVDKNQP
ncbi:hypothetical protein BG004_001158 [Podila humilis]|nr:hypothetical protein BG004_001158 [Podila humilis]